MNPEDRLEAPSLDSEEGGHSLAADDYAQPSIDELLALQHRKSLPDIPGLSYRCPPAPEDFAPTTTGRGGA